MANRRYTLEEDSAVIGGVLNGDSPYVSSKGLVDRSPGGVVRRVRYLVRKGSLDSQRVKKYIEEYKAVQMREIDKNRSGIVSRRRKALRKIKGFQDHGYDIERVKKTRDGLFLYLQEDVEGDAQMVYQDFKTHIRGALISIGLDNLVSKLELDVSSKGQLVMVGFPRLDAALKKDVDFFIDVYALCLTN